MLIKVTTFSPNFEISRLTLKDGTIYQNNR